MSKNKTHQKNSATDEVSMDLPDEELKRPLVDPSEGVAAPARSPPRPVQAVPRGHSAGSRNPPLEGVEEEKVDSQASLKPQQQQQQKPLPYAAPNVHPYAVPQYQPQSYAGNGSGWGDAPDHQPYENGSGQAATIDIVFSGMYTLAAALTIVQGFGMLIHSTFASGTWRLQAGWALRSTRLTDVLLPAAVTLGFYTMAFGR